MRKVAEKPNRMSSAVIKARSQESIAQLEKYYPVEPPTLSPRVVPQGRRAPVMATDAYNYGTGAFAVGYGDIAGFPGYPYLAGLATRAEYRAMASALSSEMTREWITLNSTNTDADEATKDKLNQIDARMKELKLRDTIQLAVEQDAYFGCSHIFIDIGTKDPALPLLISPKTIGVGSLKGFKCIEAMWTTPSSYNALDPTKPNWYKPVKWFVVGKEVHATRMPTIITRPVPDMLKPAFNFGGMSLSQLAEAYVNNWLRSRQAASDLLNNFSVTALLTDMGQILQGGADTDPACNGADLIKRGQLFTALRGNLGLMLLDKEREELVKRDTALAGVAELVAQTQEHMCAVSRMPSIILTGLSPGGLNASSDSEIRVFYDWISSQQEAYYRSPIETFLKVIQLDLFGEIDPDITFTFNPLFQMTPKELAEIRKSDADAAAAYVNASIVDPTEVRQRLARDPESGYEGLDLSLQVVDTNPSGEDDDE